MFNIQTTKQSGFTLIETLVAITILTIAIAAPLTLAAQSLMSAYSARDQVMAFHLAQDAIETVRAQRDHNILKILNGNYPTVNWLDDLYVELVGDPQKPFNVDSLSTANNFIPCAGVCTPLLFNSTTAFYGHEIGNASRFTRTVRIIEVPDTSLEEVVVQAKVQWRQGMLGSPREVVIEENLHKWIAGVLTP